MNTLPRRRRQRLKPAALLLAALAIVLGCAKKPEPLSRPPPPPDADGAPAQAQMLPLAAPRQDSLHRDANDLDDWYRVEVPGEGTLTVILDGADPAALAHLFVAVTDEQGLSKIQPTRAGGRPRMIVTERVGHGTWLIWIGTDQEATGLIPYEVRADFAPKRRAPPPPKTPAPLRPRPVEPLPTPPPPPPKPEFEKFTTSLAELERARGGAQFATIRGGRDEGLKPGLRGRFVEGGRELGRFTIVDVYSAGSRVKLDGTISGSLSSRTIVEVNIPR